MEVRYKLLPVRRIKEGSAEDTEDPVTSESPLTIYYNDEELVTLLCTWANIDELAVGFLRSEGFIRTREDVEYIRIDADSGTVAVRARPEAHVARHTFLKRYITTGCGKGTSFYHLADAVSKPVDSRFIVTSTQILELMGQAQRMSELFKITGGVHSSALCSPEKILFFREDIGRHNTVDKIIGRCLLDNIETGDKILLTTGRISSEILVKTAKLGIPLIASRSAPTDLAVKYAADLGVTITAFVRNKRMNIYTNQHRVVP